MIEIKNVEVLEKFLKDVNTRYNEKFSVSAILAQINNQRYLSISTRAGILYLDICLTGTIISLEYFDRKNLSVPAISWYKKNN